jgi:hypothetical protein
MAWQRWHFCEISEKQKDRLQSVLTVRDCTYTYVFLPISLQGEVGRGRLPVNIRFGYRIPTGYGQEQRQICF